MLRVLAGLCLLAASCGGGRLTIRVSESTLPADGFSFVDITTSRAATLRIVSGEHSARLEGSRLIAGIVPGRVEIEARAGGAAAVRAAVHTTAVWSDRFSDGTPDFLRLEDAGDVAAFVENFTALALSTAESDEVKDCSSFVRYAYREALRGYEGRTVSKYQYPYTPLGAQLFRTPEGFAEFADAETLLRHNTHFISRDVQRAAAGDLLFFRQTDQKSPWHVMIVAARDRVCYHTGPDGTWKGEIRRPTLDELRHHELPKWRPLAGNSNFLGVYRWNILRQDS